MSDVCGLQVEDLMEQVRSKVDADDEIMVQVNNKVEEWKVSRTLLLLPDASLYI